MSRPDGSEPNSRKKAERSFISLASAGKIKGAGPAGDGAWVFENMADTEEKKEKPRKKSGVDTFEIFENLFKQELEGLQQKDQTKQSPPPPPKVQKPKGPPQERKPPRQRAQGEARPATQMKERPRAQAPRKVPATLRAKSPTPPASQKAPAPQTQKKRPAPPATMPVSAKTPKPPPTGAFRKTGTVQQRRSHKVEVSTTQKVRFPVTKQEPRRRTARGEAYIEDTPPKARDKRLLKIGLPLLILLLLVGVLVRQYHLFGPTNSGGGPQTVRKKIAARPAPPRPAPRMAASEASPTATVSHARPSSGAPGASSEASPEQRPSTTAQRQGPGPAQEKRPSLPTQVPARAQGPAMTQEKEKPGPPPQGAAPEAVKPVPRPARESPSALAGLKWRSSYPFSVYLGSYRKLSTIRKVMSDYERKGVSTYWTQVDLGDKGLWYRLFTGSFSTREQAETFIQKNHLKEGESKRTRYALLIGIGPSRATLEARRKALEKAGQAPYVIRDSKGTYGLFIGAFYRAKRANWASKRLTGKGIANRVVMR